MNKVSYQVKQAQLALASPELGTAQPQLVYRICDVKHFLHKEKQFSTTVINLEMTGAKDSTKVNMLKNKKQYAVHSINSFYNPVF